MTGTEIIALALLHYGDSGSTYVSATDALQYLNEASLELYGDLPPAYLVNLMTATAELTNAGGAIPIDDAWDKIVEVYVEDTPAVQVTYDVIASADFNDYFSPSTPIYHVDTSTIWVRPVASGVIVTYLSPPSEITDASLEITDLDPIWHPVLAVLMASYMYAQEEDSQQAQHYKTIYQQKLTSFSMSNAEQS